MKEFMFSRFIKWLAAGLFGCVILAAMLAGSFLVYDQHYPPPVAVLDDVSTELVDRDGHLLRAFVTKDQVWRLRSRMEDIDEEFIKLLIAYEDKRFWHHHGVDPLAIGRAFGQLVVNGRIISGASTITMQLARLLEPRKKRSFRSKLRQMVLALQLERRMSKKQILDAYLTLAPYGGNLEGVRAASWAYFRKEPKELTLSEAALLVALPQSPERRRPDRFVKSAKLARGVVLERMDKANVIAPGEVQRAAASRVSGNRWPLPGSAAHLAQKAITLYPERKMHQVTIRKSVQVALEEVARSHARSIDPNISIAMIFADASSGEILAEIGSPDFLDAKRSGWVDMTDAVRSPGSALKPFIYGLAFEEGVVRPETLINDAPTNFSGYRPKNFDMQYQGEISIRQALQQSLNVPAVHLLEAVGPARLLALFKRAGVRTELPAADQPGLAIALGGLGISLRGLTELYAGLANYGKTNPLYNGLGGKPTAFLKDQKTIFQPQSNWFVTDILRGAAAPADRQALKIAYKTGTSYGYRDAWSIGYDGKYVLGVWVGRADNGSVPGITGRTTAAPILFDAFSKTGIEIEAFKPAPSGHLRLANQELPVTLRRFSSGIATSEYSEISESEPRIVYPPEGAKVELAKHRGDEYLPLVMKLQNGRPPFRWLANGKLFSPGTRKRVAMWKPEGTGFSKLTVIDAVGRASSVNVFISKVD